MHVIVIGAGIVGCATAYQLLRDGHSVELVEEQAQAGRVSSFANGAQLSYNYVEPLASPATLRALPKLLFEKNSALRFELRMDWKQWMWGLRFLAACRISQVQRGTRALLDLAYLSRQTLETWMQETAWEFDFARNGKLVLCRDVQSLEVQAKQVRLQASMGCEQEILSTFQCLEREPTLSDSNTVFAGGIWTAGECTADPYKLCRNLIQSISERGGILRFSHRVESIELRQGRFDALRTSKGRLHADACVVTAGVGM
jgi:D-amino-acid dehydrogenase